VTDGFLIAPCALAGLLTGGVIAFAAPRLVAYRLADPPQPPGLQIVLPIAGGWLAHLRPLRTTLLELILAATFAGLAVHYGSSIRLPLAAAYSAVLVAIAYIDLDHRLVLNRLSYPAIVLALAASAVWPDFGPLNAALGAVVALVIFGVLEVAGRGALGTGDTKLAILIGAMRGLPGVLNALFLGVVLGGVAALFLMIILGHGRKRYMAYAPYLAAGAVLSFFFAAP
jgi:leader peptidase (prepilin peptidase)/N-methyltransferase